MPLSRTRIRHHQPLILLLFVFMLHYAVDSTGQLDGKEDEWLEEPSSATAVDEGEQKDGDRGEGEEEDEKHGGEQDDEGEQEDEMKGAQDQEGEQEDEMKEGEQDREDERKEGDHEEEQEDERQEGGQQDEKQDDDQEGEQQDEEPETEQDQEGDVRGNEAELLESFPFSSPSQEDGNDAMNAPQMDSHRQQEDGKEIRPIPQRLVASQTAAMAAAAAAAAGELLSVTMETARAPNIPLQVNSTEPEKVSDEVWIADTGMLDDEEEEKLRALLRRGGTNVSACTCSCADNDVVVPVVLREAKDLKLDDSGKSVEDSSESSQMMTNTTSATNATSDGNGTAANSDDNEPSDVVKQTFGRYFNRLRKLYELDLELLEQISSLLQTASEDVVPSLISLARPLLDRLPIRNLDPGSLLSLAAMTLTQSQFQLSMETRLGDLDFINIGPIPLNSESLDEFVDLRDPQLARGLSELIVAEFDDSGVGFPIRALILGPRALLGFRNDRVVASVIATKLREFLGMLSARADITVRGGEVLLDSFLAPLHLQEGCKLQATSGVVRATARVRRPTTLRAGAAVSLADDTLVTTLLVSGDLDVALGVKAKVKARAGKSLLGRCFTKFRTSLPLEVLSRAKVWLGARVHASNVRLEKRKTPYSHGGSTTSTTFLVFHLDFDLDARLNSFDLDHVSVRNCDVRVGSFRVGSVCGAVRRSLVDAAHRFSLQFSHVHMPRLLRRLERALRLRVGGQEVSIPLVLAEEKEQLVETMLLKAVHVAELKGDLIKDLSGLASAKLRLANSVAQQIRGLG